MTIHVLQRLFSPGFHKVHLPDITAVFVDPFPASRRRPMLATGLTNFLNESAQTGVKCDVWIDGSFACAKLEDTQRNRIHSDMNNDELERLKQRIRQVNGFIEGLERELQVIPLISGPR